MSRRHCIAAFLVAAATLSACGGADSVGTSTTSSVATTTAAPTTTANDSVGTTQTSATTTTEATTTTTEATTTTIAGTRIDVTVSAGTVDAPQRPRVALGETVTIAVTADEADEAHVHGYDLFFPVGPEAVGEIEFVADIPGIFEVELEDSHQLLFELEVS